MEFYWSDANLLKDKWLRGQIPSLQQRDSSSCSSSSTLTGDIVPSSSSKDADGENARCWVPLVQFLSCNRIRQIVFEDPQQMHSESEAIKLLEEAVANSKFLKLNSLRNAVTRVAPLPRIDDSEERTLYAEHLPDDITHEALSALFSSAVSQPTGGGQVTYVSIPRFDDGRVKGFAFVEFSSALEADAALKSLTESSGNSPSGLRVLTKKQWRTLCDEYQELYTLLRKKEIQLLGHDASSHHHRKQSQHKREWQQQEKPSQHPAQQETEHPQEGSTEKRSKRPTEQAKKPRLHIHFDDE